MSRSLGLVCVCVSVCVENTSFRTIYFGVVFYCLFPCYWRFLVLKRDVQKAEVSEIWNIIWVCICVQFPAWVAFGGPAVCLNSSLFVSFRWQENLIAYPKATKSHQKKKGKDPAHPPQVSLVHIQCYFRQSCSVTGNASILSNIFAAYFLW